MRIHKDKNGRPKCGAWGRIILYLENETRQANCKRCLGQVKRNKNKNTVNRGWLMRRILEGKVMAKCNGIYTDDYASDVACNYQETGWLKAKIEDDYSKRTGNFLYFRRADFRGYGYAWRESDGTIILSFGNYSSYTLRLQ